MIFIGGEGMLQKDYAFISYSTKDEAFVANLTEILKSCQISYWKAPEMLPAGSNYAREIPKAIQESKLFILVLSGSSQESIWVEKEVDVAICQKKKIVPIRIDNTPLNDMYRFYLNNVQFVDAHVAPGKPTNMIRQRLQKELKECYKEVHKPECCRVVERPTLITSFERKSTVDDRSNALRINRIPMACEYCGGTLRQTRIGIYTCINCGEENYDDFRKVRIFLEQVGSAPVSVIAENTGVSVKTIYCYFENVLCQF